MTTKPAAPTKRAAKSKPAAETVALEEPKSVPQKGVKRTAKPAVKAGKKKGYSRDDIALRAYFIAEKRQAAGLAGDPHQDWIEAERQLVREARAAKTLKTGKS